MQHIGVTGPRKLTPAQEDWLRGQLAQILEDCYLHVGDASGVDKLARELKKNGLTVYKTEGKERWQLQARSKKLVQELKRLGGTLYAYPNKPCPTGLTLNCWKGSGTWGTITYAQSLGVQVKITPLPGTDLTDLEEEPQQLALW